MELSHLDKNGHARMVDVSAKEDTAREALASALVRMLPQTLALIQTGEMPKGDVFACARVAGILAAKRTPELIPLCHPIPITLVSVDFEVMGQDTLRVTARVKTSSRTGVEMEALTAVSVAALTVYDMCKAVDRGMQILQIQLEQKSGGKSGDFLREDIIPAND
ncbi:MAG TPA: cyclic pyranopterin monophosphate synthase MoaC [Anaerolineaceae bacterium]|nr:cyclic pyranopterin monophosphate synthase MoaC [Anaerolineaceae bacterium]